MIVTGVLLKYGQLETTRDETGKKKKMRKIKEMVVWEGRKNCGRNDEKRLQLFFFHGDSIFSSRLRTFFLSFKLPLAL